MSTTVYALQNKLPLVAEEEYSCANVFQKYTRVLQIGQGTYGEVWLATDRQTGDKVALKKIKIDGAKEKRQGFPVTAVREIRVLQRLKHDNLVLLREVNRSNVFPTNGFKGSVYLAFDYAEHDLCGLHERLRRMDPNCPQMPSSLAKSFLRQLLSAVQYCHSKKVLHRDLKSSNVLITSTGQVKLADFGLARFTTSTEDLTYRVCTLWYRPPELLLGATKYGGEVDIWSAGCIFFEMLTGRALFTGDKEASMLVSIAQLLGTPDWSACETGKGVMRISHPAAKDLKHYKLVPKNVEQVSLEEHFRRSLVRKAPDPKALDLLKAMLSLDPTQRPSAEECLQHAYFTDPSGEPEMTSEAFEELTRELPPCHEYSIKQRERKRNRREEEQPGVLSTPDPEDVSMPAAKAQRTGASAPE